jgi:hypothetical protein
MPDLMVIVSKAVFEKEAGKTPKLGDQLGMDRYVTANKALEPVKGGGKLYLVTVRPPNEALWLVAVLENPKFDGKQWKAKACTTPMTDISSLRSKIKFDSGKGISAAAGTLGMSLQTPRVLTAGDVALIRGMVPKAAAGKKVTANAAYREAVTAAAAKPKAKAKAKGGGANGAGFKLENARQPFKGKLVDLEEFEKQQLTQVVGDVAKAFDGGIEEDMQEGWIVDVIDTKSGDTKYQMHLFGYGDGCVFTNETTKLAGSICQHGFDQALPKPEMRDLAKAWARDAKRLKLWEGHIDFDSDEGEEDEEDEEA